MPEPWWKSAVIYQIYPRSFATADPDGTQRRSRVVAARDTYPFLGRDREVGGVGDLDGIRQQLDHLAWLGVDAIWLSPFFPSPMADFGYDVADYCNVDPLFGDLEAFDALVAEAHDRDIRVVIDWVPNHTSDQHPWFLESRASRDAPKRDWYVWRDGSPDTPPNPWTAAFTAGAPAWTWDRATEQWYLHLFLPEQPDLDWSNPDVVAAMHATARYWLDRGVDGFRVDVVHLLGKDPDDPRALTPPSDRQLVGDTPLTHELLRGIRQMVDGYPGNRMLVGEVFLLSTARVATYYGHDDELHLAFNFTSLFADWDAATWRRRIDRVVEELGPRDAWPTWVLSNHDVRRHHTRYGSEARARAAAVLMLTLRGTPFLYAGEEFGLQDADIPQGREGDPGGRDGCRAPIPWTGHVGYGWGTEDPWLPWPPDASTRNAEAQRADPSSILHLYRRALAERRASPALQVGTWTPLPAPEGALAYERHREDDRRVTIVNFTSGPLVVPVAGNLRVAVASDGEGEGEPYGGTLAPDQALILR
jgi:alpha-glucosidase